MTHLGTLTNADVVIDYREIERRKERFLERMAEDHWDIPMVFVAEPHPEGHGWHLHFAAPCFIDVRRLRAWWPYGIVDIRGPKGRQRKGGSPRKVGSYISKYLSKEIAADELAGCEPRPAAAHRYWKTQGHELVPVRMAFATLQELEAWLTKEYGDWETRLPFGQGDRFRRAGFWYRFRPAGPRAPPAAGLVG